VVRESCIYEAEIRKGLRVDCHQSTEEAQQHTQNLGLHDDTWREKMHKI